MGLWRALRRRRPPSEHTGLAEEEQASWVVDDSGWWGGPDETAEQLLGRMATLPPDRCELVPFRNPRVLQPDVVLRLDGTASRSARKALDRLRVLSQHVYADTLQWPIGVGPIEVLWLRAARRMIDLERAKLLARAVGRRGDLIAPYARAVGRFAVRSAFDGGEGAAGVQLSSLLLAAAEADGPDGPPVNGWTAWRWAADAHVEAAATSLCDIPDRVLFAEAKALAERIVSWADPRGPRERRTALAVYGRLHLDPFAAKRHLGDVEEYERWLARAEDNHGPDVDAPPLPEPVTALRTARAAYEQAASLGATSAWKPLVQASHALWILDRQHVDFDLASTAHAALAHLDPVTDADARRYVGLVLAQIGPAVGAATPRGAATADRASSREGLAELAERRGAVHAVTVGLWRVQEALTGSPGEVPDLLAQLWRIAVDADDEDLRRQVLEGAVKWCRRAQPSGTDDGRPFTERMARLVSETTDWSPPRRGAALLGLAVASSVSNDEPLAVPLVEEAAGLLPAGPSWRALVEFVQAQLQYGQACNLGQAGELAPAVTAYIAAAEAYLGCAMTSEARHCLERVERDASSSPETALAAVVGLAPVALRLERDLGVDATSTIATTLRTCSAQLLGGCAPDLLILRDQLAKGLRFAAAVTTPHPVELDAAARARLVECQVAARRAGSARAGVAVSRLDDEDMLASYVAPEEASAGATPAEMLLNLQRSFDEQVAAKRYAAAGDPNWRDLTAVQNLLGARTILISVFLGAVSDGRLAVHTIAVNRHGLTGTCIPQGFPCGLVQMRDPDSGVLLTQSPTGLLVANLRRQVVDDPFFDDVAPDAARELATGLPRWFGHFAGQLAQWRAEGYDHLLIWPQGPLHYVPWQLYTVPGTDRPLGADWTVTTLTSLALLGRTPGSRRSGLLSVGCANSGSHDGLGVVPEMPLLAADIAAAYGDVAVPEPEATVTRVTARMTSARLIHLATHGSHLTEAPAFQCLYLTPDGDDGRLYAYQVAQLDLRGVDLVTLSACETALGRFDLGDNSRGLPAAFLAAGASAVIGTLWPVDPESASTFFRTLYTRLAAGDGRLVAFRSAQDATRHAHSEYRSWGAFTYMGDWS